MQIFNSVNLSIDYLKVRWKEPYTSTSLNQKHFGTMPPGVYSGFVIGPGPNGPRDIIVSPGIVSSVSGTFGGDFGTGVSGYGMGAFDATIGYSVAIETDPFGFSKVVQIPPGPNSVIHLDATSVSGGGRVYVVLDAPYQITPPNDQQIQPSLSLVDSSLIDANPYVVILGHVDVPAVSGMPFTSGMFGYDDPVYPRLSPISTSIKPGFMGANAWNLLALHTAQIATITAFDRLMYAAVIGNTNGCTHPDIPTALADANVPAGSSILVTQSASVSGTISVSKQNILFVFSPGVTYSDGGAGTGFNVTATGVRFRDGRFQGFSVSAIVFALGADYGFVNFCRFKSCTDEVTDNTATGNIQDSANTTEA